MIMFSFPYPLIRYLPSKAPFFFAQVEEVVGAGPALDGKEAQGGDKLQGPG
jgi:hypothetical protein